MVGKLDYEYCRAAPVLEWMSRKWALVVLMRMENICGELSRSAEEAGAVPHGVRFGELFRSIPHVSEKVLAGTLGYLEAEGLIVRSAGNVPCYSLTPLAMSFLREISYVVEWGQHHFDEIESARRSTAHSIIPVSL